ncbi:hypothetical protein BS50DRAFT_143791 [Corynespora cassiicola Philippines]|uniref:F-box domain-containing protein n=1 Tax=Corynespora cassiicola Philippines TaxID=1448308 RepID=A0A2T2N8A5_CORCC|nr:hypothetical protein BS50DRAFT_143791 [Corynespora cassiicola Philippines]
MIKGPEPSQAEYEKLTSAAKAAGVIHTIFPYEEKSHFLQRLRKLVKKARKHEQASKRVNRVEFRIGQSNRPILIGQGDQIGPRGWEKHIFDPNLTIDEVPFDQQFCQLLRAGVDNAYAVLLLGLLPNIQDIVLQTSTIQMDQIPWKLPKHRFKNLRRLHVMAEERNRSWPVAFFEDILKAPKLEKLEVRGSSCWSCSPVGLEEDMWGPVAKWLTLPPKSTNIKIIQLDRCIMPLPQLRTLLNACQGLKGFHYTIGSSGHPSLNFSPIGLIDALGQHKDTLEELRFDISESVPVEECFWPEESRIKSIADFKSLKYFDIWRAFWAKGSKKIQAEDSPPLFAGHTGVR